MALKHAIVGLLLDHPMHGYELKRALSPALTAAGRVNDGVLYPILARLERDGLVTKTVVARDDGRPERHVLTPTRKGERWFAAWLEAGDDEDDEITCDFFVGHPFLTKCMFLRRLPPAAIRRKLVTQHRSAAAKLAAFTEIRDGMLARRVDPFRISILELGIAQQAEKVRWLAGLIDHQPRARVRGKETA